VKGSCVLGINDDPVTIKYIEVSIIEKAFKEGMGDREAAARAHGQDGRRHRDRAGRSRAADQLNRAGHFVTVFEKSDRIGGLLRYAFRVQDGEEIPERRLSLMEQEGVYFRTSVNDGVDVTYDELKAEYNAIVLAGGAGLPRDLPVPGRELKGIHFAMEYLTLSNKRVEGDRIA
jgi:glutamate synthase (NADPH/NADH) small chain